MTGPDDLSNTRPISVAELLARNGTIGAPPPVAGRRRRRRGNADSVSVAELTGEIPVIHDDQDHPDSDHPDSDHTDLDHTDAGSAGVEPAEQEDADYWDGVHQATADPEDTAPEDTAPEDTEDTADTADEDQHPAAEPEAGTGAEQMSPDFDHEQQDHGDHSDRSEANTDTDHDTNTNHDTTDTDHNTDTPADADELPSYLRASAGPLFGGHTLADDLARRGGQTVAAPEAAPVTGPAVDETPSRRSRFLRGSVIVGQSILAVVFGAALFIGFDQLWMWNNIVALVLAVLVILGLVATVLVVRKTEDIASTLIAVAVGALVTFGPLVLLHST